MLNVFGDESHDEGNERVYAVAGLIGSQSDWESVESEWLARTNGVIFHAADCESDQGDYKGIPHKENLRLYADLTQIVCTSNLFGYGAAIDLVGFSRSYPPGAVLDELPYFICFQKVVMNCAALAYLFIPREIAKFTFDRNTQHEHTAHQVYSYLANLPEWELRECLADEIASATRKTVGIQVADLLARETMKHLDNQTGPVKRGIRKSMKALAESQTRFVFSLFGQEYFHKMMTQTVALAAEIGLTHDKCLAWLDRHGLADNLSNRIKYLIFFEDQERQQIKGRVES